MQKKNLKYLSAISLITVFLFAEVYQVTSNTIESLDKPEITNFYINKTEIAEDEYEIDVKEEIRIYWDIEWGNTLEEYRYLYINYGNASGLVDITDRLEQGYVEHKFMMEGKNIITLIASNMLETTTANLTINVVNHPPEFDFAFFTEDSVNNAEYNFEEGEIPIEWDTHLSSVVSSSSIHNNVLYLNDNSQIDEASGINYFSEQSQGFIEFWVYNEFENHDSVQGNSKLLCTLFNDDVMGDQIIIDIGEDQNPEIYSDSGLVIGAGIVFVILLACGIFHYTKKALAEKDWFKYLEPILAVINSLIGYFGVGITLWPDNDIVELSMNSVLAFISGIIFLAAAVAGSTVVFQSRDAENAQVAYWIITAMFLGAIFYNLIMIQIVLSEMD
ncbi:MAG: hypothetical protein ACTSR8_20920 [Promethearchaeota archaeon]